jgi:short-subunit dehydrogenase
VDDAQAMRELAQACIERLGLPDLVIANAGFSVGVDLRHAEDLQAFADLLQTNVLGVAHTLQPFVRPMQQRGTGQLVAIASVAGLRGLAGQGAYCASKAAVITFMESLWAELRGTGVTATTINPGWVHTPLTAGNRYPMPFALQPDDFARRAVRAIARRPRLATVPWQMACVSWLLRWVPASWLAAALARKPRKQRRT